MDTICLGNAPRPTVTFTVPEGMGVEEIANKLVAEGILEDTTEFLELCRTGESFQEYSFIQAVMDSPDAGERDYAWKGTCSRIPMNCIRTPPPRPLSPVC